jgi:hypothetical protein
MTTEPHKNSSMIQRKNGAKLARIWRENGAKMARKWRENGLKMARKWRENGAKMARKWRENVQEEKNVVSNICLAFYSPTVLLASVRPDLEKLHHFGKKLFQTLPPL